MTLEEATSRCWAEIDLTRLERNYQSALRHLKEGVELIAVLKANAYGLGAPMVAKTLFDLGQRRFAVASLGEALELKRAVPRADVLILGLIGEALLPTAIENGFIITVFSQEAARQVIAAAGKADTHARVHVKVETGLHRLGLEPDAAYETALLLSQCAQVRLEGLYTHLALRDKPSDRAQLDRLYSVRDALKGAGVDIACLHALDSIGMVRYPDDQMDAVRTGAWLYGVCPRGYDRPDESQLCLAVKARVSQLHDVPRGECLGYDEDHPLARDSRIATISAGYVDGFPRLNSEGSVLIRGQRAPVVGLVCMDQMMVDVTDIPDVVEGDAATLLGGGIGVNEYADLAHLNRNEALARTGKRVPRVYYRGDTVEVIVDELNAL